MAHLVLELTIVKIQIGINVAILKNIRMTEDVSEEKLLIMWLHEDILDV